ncbi:MAG TPA: methyltransferase domain-containing protein [Candidatus Bathyarchaeia archaeon]
METTEHPYYVIISTTEDNKHELEISRYYQDIDNLYDKTKNGIIRSILGKLDLKGKTVLDLGCGIGYWTGVFAERGAKVFALDVNESKIATANYYLKKLGIRDRVHLVSADAASFDAKDMYDVVFAKDIIEHIADDGLFLRNVKAHLKDDGVAIIVTQNSYSLNFMVEKILHFLEGKKNWCGWDPTHLRFYTFQSLANKARSASMKVCRFQSSYIIPYRFFEVLSKKVGRHKVFRFFDRHCNKFPFSIAGWSIICEIRGR